MTVRLTFETLYEPPARRPATAAARLALALAAGWVAWRCWG